MTHIDRLKFELNRVNRRKAQLENEIDRLEYIDQTVQLASIGLSFDKLYKLKLEWVNWCIQNNNRSMDLFVAQQDTFRIDSYDKDQNGVNMQNVDNTFYVYSPVEYLIEVIDT